MRTLASLLLALLLPATVFAQEQAASLQIGIHGGVQATDAVAIGQPAFAGAEARISSEALPIVINPRLDYHFLSTQTSTSGVVTTEVSGNILQFGAAALYPFDAESVDPFVGGGLVYSRLTVDGTASALGQSASDSDSGSSVGLLLNVGLEYPLSSSAALLVQAEGILGGSFSLHGTESDGGNFGLMTVGLLFGN